MSDTPSSLTRLESGSEPTVERWPRPAEPRNVILIGFSYTGKTTIGRLLARKLRWRAVDTDHLIKIRTGKSPQEIFAQQGEATFRAIERDVVAEVCKESGQVISTGGGVPIDNTNRAVLFDGNLVVLLDATPEAIVQRLQRSNSGEHRPMLSSDDPLARIRLLKSQRDPIYRQAHVIVETERLTANESAELIFRLARFRV